MALIGNKVTEKDIRDYLTANGYYGRSAQINDLKLVAVKRPGWVQVFSFHLRAKQVDGGWCEFSAACRDDEAAESFEVVLAESQPARDAQVSEWSKDLITLDRPKQRPALQLALLMLFVIAMGLAVLGALMR